MTKDSLIRNNCTSRAPPMFVNEKDSDVMKAFQEFQILMVSYLGSVVTKHDKRVSQKDKVRGLMRTKAC